MSESIYDLMRKVRNHPDYVYGTVFTTDDLMERYDDLKQAGVKFPDDFDIQSIVSNTADRLAAFIMDDGTWIESIENALLINATEIPW